MSKYSISGSYAGYDKNNKEREALDFYSTPICEVENILEKLKLNLSSSTILEPSCGAGHIVQGILNYSEVNKIFASDIKDRGNILKDSKYQDLLKSGKEYDYLSGEYPFVNDIDYIIMNPPYSVFEPFVLKSLEIAKKGILVLGRLQILEGQKRYNTIFKNNPPTDIYVYVDRIACFKNGEETEKINAIQAYAWYYWNLENEKKETKINWIERKMGRK